MNKTSHDGDCWIFAANGVCTCGFFHQISDKDGIVLSTIEHERHNQHQYILYWLNGLSEKIELPEVKDYDDEALLRYLESLKKEAEGE